MNRERVTWFVDDALGAKTRGFESMMPLCRS